jgi:hypothetical protein
MTSIPNANPADIQDFIQKMVLDQIHLTAIDPERGHRAAAIVAFHLGGGKHG